MLSQKRPEAQQAHHKVMSKFQNYKYTFFYGDIDEDLVKKTAIKTKEGYGLSGLDTDNWHKILVSNKFGSTHSDFLTYCTFRRTLTVQINIFKFSY